MIWGNNVWGLGVWDEWVWEGTTTPVVPPVVPPVLNGGRPLFAARIKKPLEDMSLLDICMLAVGAGAIR